MAAVVPDELLHAVAVVADPDDVAGEIRRRYGAVLDRVALNTPYRLDPDVAQQITAELSAS